MANDLLYKVGKVGSGKYSKRDSVKSVVDLFGQRMSTIDPQYQLRVNGEDWSEDRTKRDTLSRVRQVLRNADAGEKIAVRGSKEHQARFILKVYMELLGATVVKEALSQLGVDYNWADENPEGPAGGPGSGFDCSGFVKWVYAQVDVEFPHMAEAIRVDPQVSRYTNRNEIKAGDLIFYCFGRLGPSKADHIAIALSKTTQVAASSSHDAVVRQSITTSAVMSYGFVREVTGAH
jgi:cell wall-associated NlpC family hydrolase